MNGYAYDVEDVPRRKRRGCLPSLVIGLVVVLVLAVVADFIARNVAQNEAATQIEQAGFPSKPKVSIEGFPFLTQVLSRNFHEVKLSATQVPAGPVKITQVSAVANGVHLTSGFSSGTIDQVSGTALITFPSLANAFDNAAGPAGSLIGASGLTLSAAGSDEVKASVDLLVVSGSATWRITRVSSQKLQATLVGSSGIPEELLKNLSSISIPLPKLPFGLTIGSVSVSPSGVVGQISGTDLKFG